MIRALWAWLVGRADRPATPTRSPTVFVPERDAVVREFRLKRRQSERAVRRMTRDPITRTVLGNRKDAP